MTGMSQVNSLFFVAMACVILLLQGSVCKLASCSCSLYNSFGTFLRIKGCLLQSEWWNRAASQCGNHSVGHQVNVSEQCLFLSVPVNGTIVGFDLALHVLPNCDICNICFPPNDSRTSRLFAIMTQAQSPGVFCNMLQQLPKTVHQKIVLKFSEKLLNRKANLTLFDNIRDKRFVCPNKQWHSYKTQQL